MDQRKKRKQEHGICIIHMTDAKSDDFTFIKSVKDPDERFNHLQQIKRQRLAQPLGSPYRMDEACAQLPETYLDDHGYHRTCYVRFTGNLQRLKDRGE